VGLLNDEPAADRGVVAAPTARPVLPAPVGRGSSGRSSPRAL